MCRWQTASGAFDPSKKEVVIFQGDNYGENDLADEIISFDSKTTRVDATSTIDTVFERIDGDAIPASVILKDSVGDKSIIEVNSEGRINWQ